ncbi:hypothetical protein QM806_41170, partial [Rhodococcus sp. IEGM 1351]|nr:hypothetical protein [Rhodococcus sp. IEGM 1351]
MPPRPASDQDPTAPGQAPALTHNSDALVLGTRPGGSGAGVAGRGSWLGAAGLGGGGAWDGPSMPVDAGR